VVALPEAKARTAKYVYGVVRADSKRRPKAKGIDGGSLRVVASRGLGAVTSDVPSGELEAGRDELLAHSRVVQSAFDQGPVLPMRFGVVMPGEESVRKELLDAHRADLESQLALLAGKAEFNVKAMYDEGVLLREVLDENPPIARLRDELANIDADAAHFERIRLGELVAGAVDAKRENDSAWILEALTPVALDVDVGPQIHERMVFSAAFLVADQDVQTFDDALERIAAESHPRIGFKLTGPLPPHSFVELSIEA
jgi:hypothetical protein